MTVTGPVTFETVYVARALRCPNCDVTAVVDGHPDDVPNVGDPCNCGAALEAASVRYGTVTVTAIGRAHGTITLSKSKP